MPSFARSSQPIGLDPIDQSSARNPEQLCRLALISPAFSERVDDALPFERFDLVPQDVTLARSIRRWLLLSPGNDQGGGHLVHGELTQRDIPLAEQNGSLDHVSKLPDVPWPTVAEQQH